MVSLTEQILGGITASDNTGIIAVYQHPDKVPVGLTTEEADRIVMLDILRSSDYESELVDTRSKSTAIDDLLNPYQKTNNQNKMQKVWSTIQEWFKKYPVVTTIGAAALVFIIIKYGKNFIGSIFGKKW